MEDGMETEIEAEMAIMAVCRVVQEVKNKVEVVAEHWVRTRAFRTDQHWFRTHKRFELRSAPSV